MNIGGPVQKPLYHKPSLKDEVDELRRKIVKLEIIINEEHIEIDKYECPKCHNNRKYDPKIKICYNCNPKIIKHEIKRESACTSRVFKWLNEIAFELKLMFKW